MVHRALACGMGPPNPPVTCTWPLGLSLTTKYCDLIREKNGKIIEWRNGKRMAEWRNGGWNGNRMAESRNGGMVIEWQNGGMAEWGNGGMAEWRNGGMAEW